MPVSSAYRPEPRFFDLGEAYGDAVRAADFPEARLRLRNDRAAATVGLETLTDAEWIAHFGRFEPPPVAEVGVVGAELMPVIAHGHGSGLAGQGLEPPESVRPFGLRQGVETHRLSGRIIAIPHPMFGEFRGLHRVGVRIAQIEEARGGTVSGRGRHGPQVRRRDARDKIERGLRHESFGRAGAESLANIDLA